MRSWYPTLPGCFSYGPEDVATIFWVLTYFTASLMRWITTSTAISTKPIKDSTSDIAMVPPPFKEICNA